MAPPAVETAALSLSLGRTNILDRLDLAFPASGIHALIGANGAGKSTLFRLLLGFVQPSSGQALVLGRDSRRIPPSARASIAYLNEEHRLPSWARAGELIALHRRHFPAWQERRFEPAWRACGIDEARKVSALSRGERAGLALALALGQAPELLILDEPTLGLDLVARERFIAMLIAAADEDGCAILFSSHQMDEVERLAETVTLLDRGRLRLAATPEEICARVTHWISDIPFKGPDPTTVPGLLQAQRIEGLHHHWVEDQGPEFEAFLRAQGARRAEAHPSSFARAVGAYLAARAEAPR